VGDCRRCRDFGKDDAVDGVEDVEEQRGVERCAKVGGERHRLIESEIEFQRGYWLVTGQPPLPRTLVPSMQPNLVYRILRKTADLTIENFFSEVYVEGRENVSNDALIIM
jgi:hypothetical protein